MLFACLSSCASREAARTPESAGTLRVMTWNIWHGGREDGIDAGPDKVVDVIRSSGADIVAVQETYGSGERLATSLGFTLLARGTNVSILSRYPIVEDLSVFEPFKCVGGLIEIPGKGGPRRVAVFSIWLPYDREIWERGTRPVGDPGALLAACASSHRDIRLLLAAIRERLSGTDYAGVPVIIAGDFNSMSHLDYTASAVSQYGEVVAWPTSLAMIEAGFIDAYRAVHPSVDRPADRTWSPRFPDQEQDRIDFVYSLGLARPVAARIIDTHPAGFPSDHAAVLAEFELTAAASLPHRHAARVVTYNIRHGRGMDGRVDLARTAAVLGRFSPDVVGLQEVDHVVVRSGGVDQAGTLAAMLSTPDDRWHAAFGEFMPLQGGRYGMAILSRFPIERSWSIPLPTGNEPRIALAARVVPTAGEPFTVVNVHFDWVDDDAFRFAQASRLAAVLRGMETPYVLLGDFNDQPGSRTLGLFREIAREAEKVDAAGQPAKGRDRLTFSSDKPEIEIDFIFLGPAGAWEPTTSRVEEEPMASDHRPVVAEVKRR
jgi:endonuclease/exonuclease/phosphatase family metal-dependent hydrolase